MNTRDNTVNPELFKAYDVRGVYGQNLTEEAVYRIGRAAALYLNVPEIAVCRDMRISSPQLVAAAIKGITDQGVNVIDCGLTTTDELYFIVGYYNYPAGIMITASHNPRQYNGIKFCRAQAYPISLDTGLADIRDPVVDIPRQVTGVRGTVAVAQQAGERRQHHSSRYLQSVRCTWSLRTKPD